MHVHASVHVHACKCMGHACVCTWANMQAGMCVCAWVDGCLRMCMHGRQACIMQAGLPTASFCSSLCVSACRPPQFAFGDPATQLPLPQSGLFPQRQQCYHQLKVWPEIALSLCGRSLGVLPQSATKAHTPHFILFPCATSLFTASFFVSKCSASKSKFSVILEYWLGVQIPTGHRPSDTGRRQSRQGLFDDGNAAGTHGPRLTRTIAQTSLVPLAQKSQKPQHRPNRSVRPGFRSGDPG